MLLPPAPHALVEGHRIVAECLTEAIFTQADTWEELRANTREAVRAFFGDAHRPAAIRLRLVRDEVLASG